MEVGVVYPHRYFERLQITPTTRIFATRNQKIEHPKEFDDVRIVFTGKYTFFVA